MGAKAGESIVTDELCSYGCGEVAKFKNKSNRLMCFDFANKCPTNRLKNSLNAKKAYTSGKRIPAKDLYQFLDQETKNNMAWAKGLSKDTDGRILKQSLSLTGRRRITDDERLKKAIYTEQCQFNLSDCITKVKGYDLLVQHGMYHKTHNTKGVVRDHRISVNYGFKNNIDPRIISHPANCEFLIHSHNAKKTFKNSCSLEQLLQDIRIWDSEGNWYTLLVESQ